MKFQVVALNFASNMWWDKNREKQISLFPFIVNNYQNLYNFLDENTEKSF